MKRKELNKTFIMFEKIKKLKIETIEKNPLISMIYTKSIQLSEGEEKHPPRLVD